ncbi:mltA-interacting protein, partial [Yersinia pestis PY-13]
MHANRQCGK